MSDYSSIPLPPVDKLGFPKFSITSVARHGTFKKASISSIGLLNLYLGLEYASFRINVPFLYVTKIESTSTSSLSIALSSKNSVPT